MSSFPLTVKEASRAPITSTIRHSLFCGVFSTGDGVEYTGLLGGLPVGSSSERNRLCPEDTTVGGAVREEGGGEDGAVVELLPVEFDIFGGCVREGEGISAVGVAMVLLIASRTESSKFKETYTAPICNNTNPSVNYELNSQVLKTANGHVRG